MGTIYTLEDIRDYLKQQFAIDWQCEVWDRRTGQKRSATLEDFDYSGRYSSTELAYCDKRGNDYNLEVYVTDFEFITYKDESNIMGSGSTTSFTNHCDWVGYLFETHEEEYAKSLLAHALKNKQRIKQEAEEKIEKFRWKTQQEAKGPYMYYRDLELLAKSVLTIGEIVEIEQQSSAKKTSPTSDEEDILSDNY